MADGADKNRSSVPDGTDRMDTWTWTGRGWHALPPSGSVLGGHSAVLRKAGDATAGRIDRLGRAGFIMRRPLANAVVQPRKQGAVRASSWCDLDDCVWYVIMPECLSSSAGTGGRERNGKKTRRGWWEECLPIRTDHVGASALRLMRACHQQPKPRAATGGPLLTTTEWESGRNVEQQQCRATGTRQSDFRH